MKTPEQSYFCWVAKLGYTDRAPFLFGTACCRIKASEQEVKEEITKLALKCLPKGFEVSGLIRGQLVLIKD